MAEVDSLAAAEARLEHLRVDHLVYAVPGTLEDACAEFERLSGVTPSPGGSHARLGTHNALAALGGVSARHRRRTSTHEGDYERSKTPQRKPMARPT